MKIFVNLAWLEIGQLFTQGMRRGHPCTLDDISSYPIFMKLADKDRYKIFNKLDWATLHYLLWSYMPLIDGMLGLR